MRYFLGSLLLIALQASQAATWYVRPASTGEYGAEDGTTYADAFDGFTDLAASIASVSAGDTVKVCGTFGTSDTDGGFSRVWGLPKSGSAGLEIVYDGDCSASGDLSRAVLNGGTSLQRGLHLLDVVYVTVKNLEITGATTKGILGYNTLDQTAARHITLENIYIHDINGGTNPQGGDIRGQYFTIIDSEIDGVDTDGLWMQGKYNTLLRNTVSNISEGDSSGDCFQFSGQTDGLVMDQNTCDHSNKLSKYCMVYSGITDTGTYKIGRMTCTQPTTGSCTGSPSGVYLEGTGILYGSSFVGGCNGIQHVGSGQTAAGNVVSETIENGIVTGGASTGQKIYNNTVVDTLIGINIGTNDATNEVKNNIVKTTTQDCIDKEGSSTVENYNSVSGCGGDPVSHNGTGTTPGANTITTDPGLASDYSISSSSTAWGTGVYIYPHRGYNGKCAGSVINIGATCATPVPYGYTLKPSKRR